MKSLSYTGVSPEQFEIDNAVVLRKHRYASTAAQYVKRRINKALPERWHAVVDVALQTDKSLTIFERMPELLVRMQAFEAAHGELSSWNLDDVEICEKAQSIVSDIEELTTNQSDVDRLLTVQYVCKTVGIDAPPFDHAKPDAMLGAINRALSIYWWRRQLRKKVARVVEHAAIKLGVVSKWRGGYASSEAVQRRQSQLKRNENTLKKSLIRNEAGQIYSLWELAKLSVANRDNRRGELMTRIRGCEEYADSVSHIAMFFTLTAPSKYHAWSFDKNGNLRANRHYGKLDDGGDCSPRGAQFWLRTMWARARSQLARDGIQIYGFRVAEPHHDGTPHWHGLLWFQSQDDADKASEVIKKMWLSEYGDENGASIHRVKAVAIDRTKGSAAGYIAKYITKNVGADFDINTEGHSRKKESTYRRVDAWAATWGIRQFQSVGLPSVTVWRCLRGVDASQANEARVNGDKWAGLAHSAAHKVGGIPACFKRYMHVMGGVCLKRGEWSLQLAKRVHPAKNGYGELLDKKTNVGVITPIGTWLVSKRQAWVKYDAPQSEGGSVPESIPVLRGAIASAWTRFNNCTARLTGTLRRELFGKPSLQYDTFEIYDPPLEWKNERRWCKNGKVIS